MAKVFAGEESLVHVTETAVLWFLNSCFVSFTLKAGGCCLLCLPLKLPALNALKLSADGSFQKPK